MTARDLITVAIRTVAQAIGAYIITFLIAHGINLPDTVAAQVNVYAYLIVLGVWALAINWLATHVHPAFGYLAIIPKQPTYPAARGVLAPENPVPPATSAGDDTGGTVVGFVILVLAIIGLIAVLVYVF